MNAKPLPTHRTPSSRAVGLRPLLWLSLAALVPATALGGPAARVLGPENAGHAVNPQLSPDGARVVYEVTYPQEKFTELWSVDVVSGTHERVRPSLASSGLGGRGADRRQVNHEFAFSPKGDLHAFASSGHDEEFDIWIAGVSVPIGSDQKEGGVVFAPDGRSIVYCSARSGEGDLYLHDLYALEKPPTPITSRADGLEFYATFAPAGSRLAYVAMGEQGATLRVIDDITRASKTDRAAVKLSGSSLKPSFSPDGKWIAFFSNADNDESTRFDLWLVPAAGGEPFRAVRGVLPPERHGPAWLPDSTGIVVVLADPNLGDPLARLDLATLRAEPIPTGTVNNGEPDVRRDARTGQWRLVFTTQGERGSEGQGWRRTWLIDLAPVR